MDFISTIITLVPLRSSGITFWRLGTLAKENRPWIWAGWMGEDVHLVIVMRKGRSKGRCLFCAYCTSRPWVKDLI